MNASDLSYQPAHLLAHRIRQRELSPVEVLDHFLARIETHNPVLNAFLTVPEEIARKAAKRAEKQLRDGTRLGPLHGVPVAIKDMEYTQGVRTTLGSRVYRDFVPEFDAIIVERLKRAGAIVIGKTNTPEFALLGETRNALGPECCNPWDITRTTGGSSGGSAAALAAGLTPLATGSDSGGSITIPAAFCGVYGLKPSHGRIPQWPSMGDWPLFLDSGPLSRDVRDAALMLNVVAGHDPRDPMSLREPPKDYLCGLDEPLPPMRVAWAPALAGIVVDSELREAAGSVAATFERLGHHVEEAAPDIGPGERVWETISLVDEYLARGKLLASHPEELYPDSLAQIRPGKNITGSDYARAARCLSFQSNIGRIFERVRRFTCARYRMHGLSPQRSAANHRWRGIGATLVPLFAV